WIGQVLDGNEHTWTSACRVPDLGWRGSDGRAKSIAPIGTRDATKTRTRHRRGLPRPLHQSESRTAHRFALWGSTSSPLAGAWRSSRAPAHRRGPSPSRPTGSRRQSPRLSAPDVGGAEAESSDRVSPRQYPSIADR